jgi:hypothetical protein
VFSRCISQPLLEGAVAVHRLRMRALSSIAGPRRVRVCRSLIAILGPPIVRKVYALYGQIQLAAPLEARGRARFFHSTNTPLRGRFEKE